MLTSQTIGVEFASKIVRVGTGPRRKRIKLQLWDTAGTERFRSVSRSYYRGAAGAVLVYDVSDRRTLRNMASYLQDIRALASHQCTVVLAGNKLDLGEPGGGPASRMQEGDADQLIDAPIPSSQPSTPSKQPAEHQQPVTLGSKQTATVAPDGREILETDAAAWATSQNVSTAVEVSALNGEGVDELFTKLAGIILTRIELGEIDPSDPTSGIQYGDIPWEDGASVQGVSSEAYGGKKRGWFGLGGRSTKNNTWMSGMRDWEEVFRVDAARRKRRGCC